MSGSRDSDAVGVRLAAAAAERARDTARSRRAGAGSVTEMARSLLHDARRAEESRRSRGQAPCRAGAARSRRRSAGTPVYAPAAFSSSPPS